MDIRVSGHQVETGAALQEHASDRLGGIVEKYFERALSSHVTFGKAAAGAFRCDIVTHVTQGTILKAQGEAHDAHVALDNAAAKIEKQLRRYKRRLKDRHERALQARAEEEAAYTVFAIEEEEEEATVDAPPIIAETSVDIPSGTVADAVMMLDLRDTNALFFKTLELGAIIWSIAAQMVRSDGSNRVKVFVSPFPLGCPTGKYRPRPTCSKWSAPPIGGLYRA